MGDVFPYFQIFHLANHFIHCLETKVGHDFTKFLHHELEEVHHMVWVASKTFPQFWILCGHTNWASVSWHLRIMIQPSTINAAVATPHSSAPNKAATAMSRPVFICPSACTTTRLRNPFFTSV
jgi:hypothetical protein